jgi:hypothetical protein
MDVSLVYLVIVILVISIFLWVTLQSRQGPGRRPPAGRQQQTRPRARLETQGPPTAPRTPRRETWGTSTPGIPQQRERRDTRPGPVATAPRQDNLERARLESQLDWSTAQSQQGRERSGRPVVSNVATPARQASRQPESPVLPSRSWLIAARRARPEMLASPRAARQAFLAMELLRPPLALRKEGEEAMSD